MLTLSPMAGFRGKTKFLGFCSDAPSATKRFARSRIFRYGCLMIFLSNRQKEREGGGAVRPSLPFSLPFTQNYLEATIPENSWPCKPFCCGCPYDKKIKKFSFTGFSFFVWYCVQLTRFVAVLLNWAHVDLASTKLRNYPCFNPLSEHFEIWVWNPAMG